MYDDTLFWLERHAEHIQRFMDYAPRRRADAKALSHSLGQWFNNPRWSGGEHRFEDLGYDSLGGQFAAWYEGDAAPAVVYFGSEGGRGVLAPTLDGWLIALAHGPKIIESSPRASVYFPNDHRGAARAALAQLRRAVEARVGPLAPQPPVVDPALDSRFREWVGAQIQAFSIDDITRYGLSGGASAGALRRQLGARLGWGKLNAKAMLKRMNRSGISRDHFEAALTAAQAEIGGS